MAKTLALFLLLVSFFGVFAEKTETLPHAPLPSPEAAPPHYHHHHPHPLSPTPAPAHPLSPTPAPAHPPTPGISHPPAHPPHHHHHHHPHPPAPAPVKTPVHPPTPAPAKPPTHHYPPTPAPAKPPTHHHYPPTPSPVKPPTHPHYPPTPPPVHPPAPVHPFPRSFVAVQGVVYSKSCKYAGVDTLLGATPVLGAVVKLECNNTKYPLVQTGKTDKNGYFYLEAPKTITTYGAHKCKVFLISEPTGLKPSNLHGGVTGSPLKPQKPFMSQKLPFLLYNVGPLAFEPKCPR